MLRIVYMGTPEFAVPALAALHQHSDVEVAAVFSRVDAVSKRGKQPTPSAVSQYALDHEIKLYRVTSLRQIDVVDDLRDLRPDLIVVAAYGMLLPQEVLDIPRLGCINLHASLLPRWRGAAPIQRAILAGDERVGVCLMAMELGLDTGPYCACADLEVGEKNAPELTKDLAQLAAQLLIDNLPAIASGDASWTAQDESLVTYADKMTSDDVKLHPTDTAVQAERKVRASSPQSPCRIQVEGQPLTILGAVLSEEDIDAEPGKVVSTKQGVFLGFSEGLLELTVVQKPGKNPVAGLDWWRGARSSQGALWS